MEAINNPFFELAAILMIAAIAGMVGRLLKQPLIVAFIGIGILVREIKIKQMELTHFDV